MKKVLSVALGLSMALSVLVGCGGAPSQSTAPVSASEGTSASQSEAAPEAEPAKIAVAYHPHITGVGGLLNAIDNGYFEEENLEIELVQFTSGATELAAMASGEIDIGYLGVGAHVFAPQGQCVILALDSTDVSGEIMTPASTNITTMQDLKGKNVAISAGTTSELVLSMGLKLNGMEKSDVNMINMDASGKVTAFMTNQIDAISIESPYTDQIRKDMGEENVVTLCSSADFLPDAVFTNSWVTTQSFLEDNEDVVVRFLRAWLKGTQDRYDDMDGTVAKVAKYINTDYDTAHLVSEKTNWLSTSEMKELAEDGTMLKWYDTVKDMFLDAGLLDPAYDVPADQYVKLDYLLQAMEDVGVE